MTNRWTRIFGIVAAAAVLTASPGSARTRADRAVAATGFIARHQLGDGSFASTFGSPVAATADAAVSLVAAGRGSSQVDKALDYLEANVALVDTVGLKAKAILAAVAGGRAPTSFGGRDLVQELEAVLQPDGRYQSSLFSQVYDQALAILALRGAGEVVPRNAASWLARAQCRNGGWQFDQAATGADSALCKSTTDPANDFTESDTNTTSLAVQALAAASRSVPLGADPFRYFARVRDPIKRGWGFDRTFRLTDTVSTSLVVQAYASVHRALPRGAGRALAELQRDACKVYGAFATRWVVTKAGRYRRAGADVGATVAAVPALLRRPFPIKAAPYLLSAPRPPLCSS